MGELELTVSVELGELVQIGAKFGWKMFCWFVQEAERGHSPTTRRQNQNLGIGLLL